MPSGERQKLVIQLL